MTGTMRAGPGSPPLNFPRAEGRAHTPIVCATGPTHLHAFTGFERLGLVGLAERGRSAYRRRGAGAQEPRVALQPCSAPSPSQSATLARGALSAAHGAGASSILSRRGALPWPQREGRHAPARPVFNPDDLCF